MRIAVPIDPRMVQDVKFVTEDMIKCSFCREWIMKLDAEQTRDRFLICAECFRENIMQCAVSECGRMLEIDVDRIEYLADYPLCASCYDDICPADGEFDPVALADKVNVQCV